MKNVLNDRVRVQIFGREYEMDPGGLTALEVQSLASFVDERMREIAEDLSIVDTQKVAVLASINIALDYLQLKEKNQSKGQDVGSHLVQLTQKLNSALNA
ncbi:MAG: Cell division protein ZapA [Elusimicrobia bacterium]|nr:Cell division protein ZapA [Elusimicrobiota bacterium]